MNLKALRRRGFSVWSLIFGIALWSAGCGGGGGPSTFSPPGGDEITSPVPGSSDFGQATLSPAQAGGWSIETVDATGNIGWQTSIEVGVPASTPLVHISYYEQVGKDLKLASGFQGGPWTVSTLDAPFDVGRYNSIVSGGISYYQAYGKLKAWRPAAPGPEVVDPQADLGAFNDIAVGDGGELHVSYSGTYFITNLNKRAQVRHAVFDGVSWSKEVVDDGPATAGSFSFTSIAYNPSPETYHISYRGQNGRLKHASGNTGSWSTEEVLPGNPMTSNVGQTSALVSPDGTLHIFYSKVGAGAGLYHAWNAGAGWNVELVALGFGVMTPSAAVGDLMGTLHVAAYKSNTQDLVLFSSGSWTSETLDSPGDVGKFAAMAVDAESCLHLSYVNATSADLKYATNWKEGGCVDLSQVWVDDDWAGTSCGTLVGPGKMFCTNAFDKIQDGVNAVNSGGTVNVALGTYLENVVIQKSLTLQGESGSQPKIIGQDDGTGSVGIIWVKDMHTWAQKSFTIDNFLLEDGTDYGIKVSATPPGPDTSLEGMHITHNTFHNSGLTTDCGAEAWFNAAIFYDLYLWVWMTWPRPSTYFTGVAEISHNVIYNDHSTLKMQLAIGARSGRNLIMDDNTIYGDVCEGIHIWGSDTSNDNYSITNNHIDLTGYTGAPIGWNPRGIWNYGSHSTISGNTVISKWVGIVIEAWDNTCWDGPEWGSNFQNTVSNNLVHPPLGEEMVNGIVIQADYNTVTENEVYGATYGASGKGMRLRVASENPCDWGTHGSTDNNTIFNNYLHDNDHGLYIVSDNNLFTYNNIVNNQGASSSGVHLTDTASGNVFHFNNVVGNSPGGYGIFNGNTGEMVNAENNWWGDASGPYDPSGTSEVPLCNADPADDLNADGLGDPVSDNVAYCPWAAFPF